MKTIFGQKCIIYDRIKKKILILRRSNYKKDGGLWDLIGGSVDFGEDSKEAIIREGYEETGIKIKKPKIIDLYSKMVDSGVFFIPMNPKP
jgi:8-oxo-dGTP diphosphatase